MEEEYKKLKASYEALQRDYTKKCQLLKTYREKADKASPPAILLDNLSEVQLQQITENERVKQMVIYDYIANLRNGASPILMTSQGEIKAIQQAVPKSIREAGELARRVLKIR